MSGIEPLRLAELLDGITRIRVLVVGDLMLDRYVGGHVDRVSPEAPVPVVRVAEERTAIGGAGNVAANVRSLGATSDVVGCVGDDAEGEQLLDAIAELGIGSAGIVRASRRPTTVKTRVHAGQHQIVRFDREVEGEVDDETTAAVARSIRELAAECDALVVQDYNKGVLTPGVVDAMLEASQSLELPLVVDPKRRGFFSYAGATVFKPNRRELEDALSDFVHPDDEAWMEATRRRLGCTHLLVTLGDEGMALKSEGGSLERLPAAARGVYDVSGAGDTVSAALAVALAAGATIGEAAFLANHAAAVEVGRPGVQTVTTADIEAQVRSWPD